MTPSDATPNDKTIRNADAKRARRERRKTTRHDDGWPKGLVAGVLVANNTRRDGTGRFVERGHDGVLRAFHVGLARAYGGTMREGVVGAGTVSPENVLDFVRGHMRRAADYVVSKLPRKQRLAPPVLKATKPKPDGHAPARKGGARGRG